MLSSTLINYSNNYIYIDRLDDIIRIAFALKAQVYYVDAISNKIFGFYEEGYSIIETVVPFKLNTSFLFSGTCLGTTKNKEYININKTYFMIPDYPFILFPENKRADLMNNNINFSLDSINGEYFTDKMTGKVFDDIMISFDVDKWFLAHKYTDILNSYINRHQTLGYSYIFENMNENNTIQEVTTSKVSQGAKLMDLIIGEKHYTFYVFKSLIGPLTKSDNLTIIITPDLLEKDKFKLTFRVYKKKSKLGVPELIDMSIDTNVFMLNLS